MKEFRLGAYQDLGPNAQPSREHIRGIHKLTHSKRSFKKRDAKRIRALYYKACNITEVKQ